MFHKSNNYGFISIVILLCLKNVFKLNNFGWFSKNEFHFHKSCQLLSPNNLYNKFCYFITDDWEEAHEKLSELIKNNNIDVKSYFKDSLLENDDSQDVSLLLIL